MPSYTRPPPSTPLDTPTDADRFVKSLASSYLEGRQIMRVSAGDIARDPLRDAVHMSLFTWRRARPDDPVPDEVQRQGWWADPEFGSRLWLLSRSKLDSRALAKARDYAEEALAWLVTEGLAKAVKVEVERRGKAQIVFAVSLTRPRDPRDVVRYDEIWGG